MSNDSYFDSYLTYTAATETPRFFHRWSAVVGLGAWLGRNFFLPFGHSDICPNLYVMLLGSPGTRKSSAIKTQKKFLAHAGYYHFAADKTTKEKFLIDLEEGSAKDKADSIFEDLDAQTPRECFIAPDEFGDFFGSTAVLEFLSTLGVLWDFPEEFYESRLKNSKSLMIYAPYISMLTGNTPTTLAAMIPPEAIGQGFFSRLLLVHADKTDIKITFPPRPDQTIRDDLIERLKKIKSHCVGEATMTAGARDLVDQIYTTWPGMDDIRFEHYGNRRLTQLLKLCLIYAAARISTEISVQDVIHANSLLAVTEYKMPKALGEFGKGKNSDVAHKVMQAIESQGPITVKELFKHMLRDVAKATDLQEIINGLILADKIQVTSDGYLPKKKSTASMQDQLAVDLSLFSFEEIYK